MHAHVHTSTHPQAHAHTTFVALTYTQLPLAHFHTLTHLLVHFQLQMHPPLPPLSFSNPPLLLPLPRPSKHWLFENKSVLVAPLIISWLLVLHVSLRKCCELEQDSYTPLTMVKV